MLYNKFGVKFSHWKDEKKDETSGYDVWREENSPKRVLEYRLRGVPKTVGLTGGGASVPHSRILQNTTYFLYTQSIIYI